MFYADRVFWILDVIHLVEIKAKNVTSQLAKHYRPEKRGIRTIFERKVSPFLAKALFPTPAGQAYTLSHPENDRH